MKPKISAIVLFVVALIVFSVTTLPARVATSFLPANLPIKMAGVQGTIWNGSAADTRWKNQPLGKLEWQLSAFSLLLARVSADFTLSGEHLNANGTASATLKQHVTLKDTELNVDVANQPFFPMPNILVKPEGQLKASIKSLHMTNPLIESADGTFVWHPAKIVSPAEYDLGQITLVTKGEGYTINGTLSSKNGPVNASGALQVTPKGVLNVDIKLAAHKDTPSQIRNMLPMAGKPDGNGNTVIKRNFPIPGWPQVQ